MLRTTRVLLASTVVTSSLFAASAAASAAGTGTGPEASGGAGGTETALRFQAQELAGEIQSEGVQLDQLAEAYDSAHLRSQQLESRLQVLRTQMAKTDGEVTVARADLKEQALVAYLAGGAPLISELPGRPGSDPSLTVSYAEIVSGGQRRAVDAYRAVLASQTSQSKQLTAADRQVVATLAVLRTDRAAASQAMAARQQTLNVVQGQLATLVAQFQAQQQQAEQRLAGAEGPAARRGWAHRYRHPAERPGGARPHCSARPDRGHPTDHPTAGPPRYDAHLEGSRDPGDSPIASTADLAPHHARPDRGAHPTDYPPAATTDDDAP